MIDCNRTLTCKIICQMSPSKSGRAKPKTATGSSRAKASTASLRVDVSTNDPPTVVHLLASHDADVVRTTLATVCAACEADPSCFAKLAGDPHIYKHLSDLLQAKDAHVLRQALYVLDGVLDVNAVVLLHEVNAAFAKISNAYLQCGNDLAVSAMNKLLDWHPDASGHLFEETLVDRTLAAMKGSPHAHVRTGCAKLVMRLSVDPQKLLNLPNFNPGLFVCLLKDGSELRRPIIEFLTKLAIAGFALQSIAPGLIDLLDPDTLNLCALVLDSEEGSTKFVTTEHFFRLLSHATCCPDEHRLPLLRIFGVLAKGEALEYRQRLHDCGLERAVLHLLESQKEEVLCQAAAVMLALCNHTYGVATMVNEDSIGRLVHMLESNSVGMIVAAVPLAQKLLARNDRALKLFASRGASALVKALLGHSKEIPEEILEKILCIIQMYVVHPTYRDKIVGAELLVQLLSLYESSTSEELALRAAHVLNDLFAESSCRSAFFDASGHKILMSKLESAQSEGLVKCTLVMIKTLIVYRKINERFARDGLAPLLSKYESRYVCARLIVEALYSFYLPLKFHKTNALSITDVIRDNFYVINGEWKDEFPFLEQLVAEKRSVRSTIYVVDYSYARRVQGAARVAPDVAPVNYGGITEDPYLYDYFVELGELLTGGLEEKLRILAKYVADKLTGYAEQASHVLDLHLSALKERLGSNIIPIGFLRHGSVCERALLFKTLADRFEVPATLRRSKGVYWNEAAYVAEDLRDAPQRRVVFRIVDLFDDVGATYEMESDKGKTYMEFLARQRGH